MATTIKLHYKFYVSSEIPEHLLSNLTVRLNGIYHEENSVKVYRNKYQKTLFDESFHAFLCDSLDQIIAHCALIPYPYLYRGQPVVFVYATDFFVDPSLKNSQIILRQLYRFLKQKIQDFDISHVAILDDGVNEQIIDKIGGIKIGRIPEYLFKIKPVKTKWLGFINSFFQSYWSWRFKNRFDKKKFENTDAPVSMAIIEMDSYFEEHRYRKKHRYAELADHHLWYKVDKKDNNNEISIIEFHSKKAHKRKMGFHKILSFLLRKENPNLIRYLGNLREQGLKIKSQKQDSEWTLYIDTLKESVPTQELMDIENWGFSGANVWRI